MHQINPTQHNDTSPCTIDIAKKPLLVPSTSRDLAIIGGGLGGLSVGKAAIELVQSYKESVRDCPSEARVPIHSPIKTMSLLVGGESLAYSPVRGDFSELLTLSGTDKYSRVAGLDRFRQCVEDMFREFSFEFKRDTVATSITKGERGTFLVEESSANGRSHFESEKLVLALGHTLREVSSELHHYVIRGAGELCAKLARELPQSDSKEACLDRLLMKFKPVRGESIRIGLVGLGASMIEVVKILETLLEKPDGEDGKYLTVHSRQPIEIVIFDPHIKHVGTLFYGLYGRLWSLLGSSQQETTDDVTQYNSATVGRFEKFYTSGQLSIEPYRIDWNTVRVCDHVLVPKTETGRELTALSLLIDCAPFEEGIGPEQYAVIEALDMIELEKVKSSLWRAHGVTPEWKDRLALAGAAVIPRRGWSSGRIEDQAKEIIGDFYPKRGEAKTSYSAT